MKTGLGSVKVIENVTIDLPPRISY